MVANILSMRAMGSPNPNQQQSELTLNLGAASTFFSTSVIFHNQPFSPGFWRFSRKKDPSKEWGRCP